MQLEALPALSDNYIWMVRDDAGRGLFVDPGDAGPVLQAAAAGVEPVAVLLTHHHSDHIGGTFALQERWPQLRVFAPEDARIHNHAQRVGDDETFDAAGWRLRAMAVPGHTRTHTAYFLESDAPAVFCGDTLFSLGCGRLFEGTPEQMHASLSRLATLPRGTQVCCGHEYTLSNAAFAQCVDPDNAALEAFVARAKALRQEGRPTLPSTLADELDCNPFLRCDAPAVRDAVTARLGREPVDAVETFAELRRWKDDFRA